VLAVQADGATITTIEGLAKDGKPSPVEQAFIEEGAIQCGFCTPGHGDVHGGIACLKPASD